MIAATWRTAVFVCFAAAAIVGFAFLHAAGAAQPYRGVFASVSWDQAWGRAHVQPQHDAAEYGLQSSSAMVFREGDRLSARGRIRPNGPGGTACLIIAASTTGRSVATECKPLAQGWYSFPNLYLPTTQRVGVAYRAMVIVHGNPHGFETQGLRLTE